MTNVNVEEELLSSIASLSPPLSLKSGTLDLPLVTDSSLPLDSNPTPDPTLPLLLRTLLINQLLQILKLVILLPHLLIIFILQ